MTHYDFQDEADVVLCDVCGKYSCVLLSEEIALR